jgi:16S rRNA processing protein RimM
MTARDKAERNLPSGSPFTGEPEYLVVGHVRRPHGLRGDMLLDLVTDFPERLQRGTVVFLGQPPKPAVIEQIRPAGRGMIVKFRGTESSGAAAKLRNVTVFVKAMDRPNLAPGQYYHHQILGCAVVDERDRVLGTLTEILETGANDVYVVQAEGGQEILLPAIESVILEVNLGHRKLRVRLPEVRGPEGPS